MQGLLYTKKEPSQEVTTVYTLAGRLSSASRRHLGHFCAHFWPGRASAVKCCIKMLRQNAAAGVHRPSWDAPQCTAAGRPAHRKAVYGQRCANTPTASGASTASGVPTTLSVSTVRGAPDSRTPPPYAPKRRKVPTGRKEMPDRRFFLFASVGFCAMIKAPAEGVFLCRSLSLCGAPMPAAFERSLS